MLAGACASCTDIGTEPHREVTKERSGDGDIEANETDRRTFRPEGRRRTARGVPPQARLPEDEGAGWRAKGSGARGEEAEGTARRAPVRHTKARRDEPALRPATRARRRDAQLGRTEGAVARSVGEAARDAGRGSSDRVQHVR